MRLKWTFALLLLPIFTFAKFDFEKELFKPKPETPPAVYLVEFKGEPSSSEVDNIREVLRAKRAKKLDNYDSSYFRRLYRFSEAQHFNYRELVQIQKKWNLVKVEIPGVAEGYSIDPSREKNPTTNDPYFNHQWALWNNGQIIYRDIDATHLETINGVTGADIGFHKAHGAIRSLGGRFAKVAILDSGLDFDHKDLKADEEKGLIDKVLTNLEDCDEGRIPVRPEEDKDGNGYKGDCKGWNFTTKNPEGDNNIRDKIGHGTHVAGILAAHTNNEEGVSGISDQIKVLPVKVLAKGDERREADAIGFSDRIAKGVLYAIKRDVDVINLSLGWPASQDTKHVREAIQEALKKGITVVAAAGNNNNNNPIFPCAYQGVICVGGVGNELKATSASNFGGHVDVLAPGDNILSLFPEVMDPLNFSEEGYDIKHGTSQAAPFVSALAALLKLRGVNDPKDIRAHIISSAKPVNDAGKFFQYGLIDYQKALQLPTSESLYISFKDLKRVVYSRTSKRFSLQIPIENLSRSSRSATFQMRSLSPNVRLDVQQASLSSIGARGVGKIGISGSVLDEGQSNSFILEVTMTSNGKKRMARHNIILNGDLEGFPGQMKLAFQPKKFENLDDLVSVERKFSPFQLGPSYFTNPETRDTDREVHIYTYGPQSMNLSFSAQFSDVREIVSVTEMDANKDGQRDFMIRTLHRKDGKGWIQYNFFNESGEGLFGEHSVWRFIPEVTIWRADNSGLIDYEHPQLGSIRVPIMILTGRIPKDLRDPDPLDSIEPEYQSNVYYLVPELVDGQMEIKTKTFNGYKRVYALMESLGLDFRYNLDWLYLLPSTDSLEKKVVLSVGRVFDREYYLVTIRSDSLSETGPYEIAKMDLGSDRPEGHSVGALKYSPQSSTQLFTLTGFFKPNTLRVSKLSPDAMTKVDEFQYRHSVYKDKVIGFVSTYLNNGKVGAFLQTTNYLVSVDEDQNVQMQPVIRYSFVRGLEASELLFPVSRGSSPAVYIDAVQLSGRYIFNWTLDERGTLLAPARLAVNIPPGCLALNPVELPVNTTTNMAVLCDNNGSMNINYLPIQ